MKGRIMKAIAAGLASMLIIGTPVMAMTDSGMSLNIKQLYSGKTTATQSKNVEAPVVNNKTTVSPTVTPTVTPTTTPTVTPTTTPSVTPASKEVIGITLNVGDTLSLEKGDKVKIKANVITSEGTYNEKEFGSILWSAEGDSSISVSPKQGTEATVEALTGNKVPAYVTATIGKYEATVKVAVKEYASEISITPELTGYAKHKIDLNKEITRIAATSNDMITWTSDNSGYVKVDKNGIATLNKVTEKKVSGVMTPVTVKVTATTEHGATAVTTVKVEAGKPAKYLVANKGDDLAESKETLIIASTTPEIEAQVIAVGADEDKLTKEYVEQSNDTCTDVVAWTSSKTTVATVVPASGNDRSATIVGVGIGTAKITAKTSSGKSVSYSITVKAPLTGIGIIDREEKNNGEVIVGTAMTLYSFKTPRANKESVKWSVDKEHKNFASIKADSKNGTALVTTKYVKNTRDPKLSSTVQQTLTITATSGNKKDNTEHSATYTLVVNPTTISAVAIKPDFKNIKMFSGTEKDYSVTLLDAEGKSVEVPGAITWKSSNPKVASIDTYGQVTALKAGNVKITASVVNVDGRVVNNTTKGIGANATKSRDTMTLTVVDKTKTLQLNKSEAIIYTYSKTDAVKNKATVTLKATKNPKTTKDTIVWSMTDDSDKNITVDSKGKVTVAAGTKAGAIGTVVATVKDITAGANTHVIAKCDIKVLNKATSVVTKGKVDGNTSRLPEVMKAKDSIHLNTTVYGTVGTDTAVTVNTENKVTYTSSNKKAAVVDANGIVYAVKGSGKEGKGTKVTITAKTLSGKSAKYYISVE